jgi:hypothetical protein
MRGAIHPFPQYAFMVWCSVKSTGATLPFLPLRFLISMMRCVASFLHHFMDCELFHSSTTSAIKEIVLFQSLSILIFIIFLALKYASFLFCKV